jgi:hypothetical protein
MACSKPLRSSFNHNVPHPLGERCRATSPDWERHNLKAAALLDTEHVR